MTIISFAGIFAALGVAETGGNPRRPLARPQVFAGSAAWSLLLSGGVGLMRERLATGALLWVDRASGVVLVVFGAAAVSAVGCLKNGASGRDPGVAARLSRLLTCWTACCASQKASRLADGQMLVFQSAVVFCS